MNNSGSKTRFVITAIFCLGVIIYAIYYALFSATPGVSTDNKVNDIEQTTQSFTFLDIFGENNNLNETNSTTVSTVKPDVSFEQMVQAASNGTVKGKVIEKFISPYTAKYSYNNVYLKNSTDLSIDIKSLLNSPLKYKITKNSSPQVLIVHTHATESFLLNTRDYYTDKDTSRTTNNDYNMVALGKIVADTLNGAGINTLHDTTQHDFPSYNESYSRAAKTINGYKAKYKDLKIVIDLHRDALSSGDTDKVKLTTEISGKKAAQIMIVMGSQSGSVTNFPKWQENLKLALKLQQQIEIMYPTLARSLSLMPKNYNESLTTGSMLIEIGTDGNSLEEVRYSAQLLADALVCLFNNLS